jgi:hypothetical protein
MPSPKTPLLGLIATGRLRVGTTLHHRGRQSSGRNGLEATVVKDGIRFDGRVYRTPSAAAKSVTGKPVDGWNFWRTPDGKQLSELR